MGGNGFDQRPQELAESHGGLGVDSELGRLGGAVRDIGKCVAEAAAMVPFTASSAELGEAFCELQVVRASVDALAAQLTDAASASGVQFGAGNRTIDQYVAAGSNADPKPVRRSLRLGRWLRKFPVFADGFAAGVLTEAHVRHLMLRLDGPNTHRLLVGAQEFLVDTARSCSFEGFLSAAEYWMHHADPNGVEPKDQAESTKATLRKGRGGRVHLDAELDAVEGAAVRIAIEAEVAQLYKDDIANGVKRTDRQRRAAALVNLIKRGHRRSDRSLALPLINLVMSQAVAEWLIAWDKDNPGDSVPVAWNDIDGRCELIDGTPIHPLQALKYFGIATLRRHVTRAESRPDVSVNARSFPQWMKNALLVESRGKCTEPGCDAPHSWLESDHITAHSKGGPTALWNGQTLCRPANQAKSDRNLPRRE